MRRRTTAPRVPLVRSLLVLLTAAACRTPPRPDAPTDRPTAAAAAPARADGTRVLASYVGTWDGRALTLTRVDAATGRAVQAVTLGDVDASTSGSSMTPAPGDFTVDLHQTADRGLDTDCNSGIYVEPAFPTSAVPSPFQGVCFSIDMVSGFLSEELIRAHVEVTSLSNSNGSGPITTYNDSPSDSDFGITGAFGLWGYGRLAIKGVTGVRVAGGATVDLSRATRNWFFATPEPGLAARFTFRFDVRGAAALPVARLAPASGGTECAPSGAPGQSDSAAYDVFSTSTIACRAGGGPSQVYRRERATGTTVLVSYANGASTTGSNGTNTHPSVSFDGRVVAWESTATDLVGISGDTNGVSDGNGTLATIYVRDMDTGNLYIADVNGLVFPLVSGLTAAHNPKLSPDSTTVVFDTGDAIDINGNDSNALRDVYAGDWLDALAFVVSPDTGSRTADATLGATCDGSTFFVWQSADPSFVAGDTNGASDVFVTDYSSGSPVASLLSARSAGGGVGNGASTAGAVSTNCVLYAFASAATDLGPSNSSAPTGGTHVYAISPGGGAGLAPGVLLLADVTTAGAPGNGSASAPGIGVERMVTFVSTSSDLDALDNSAGADAYLFDAASADPRRARAVLLSATQGNAPANAVTAVALVGDPDELYLALTTSAALAGGSPPAGLSVYVAPLR